MTTPFSSRGQDSARVSLHHGSSPCRPANLASERQAADPDRRRALASLWLGAVALVMLPWRTAQAKKIGLAISQLPALAEVGGSATLTVKGQELLLIRTSQTTIKALDPMCTHKKCKVFYRPKDNDIGCKCHKSKFTLDGIKVSGPAPRPLGRFPAKIKGDKIVVDLG